MSAIAYALYFRDYGKKHCGEWRVFTPTFGHGVSVRAGQPDPWQSFRHLLASGHYIPMPVAHAEVFSYGVLQMEHGHIMFRMMFYERVVVHAWTHFNTLTH